MIELRKDKIAYVQISNHLLKRIALGEFNKGDVIGSIRTLSVDYCVTTKTIQKAIDQLELIKVVERIPAKGIFIIIKADQAKVLLIDEARKQTLNYINTLKELHNFENIDQLIKWGKENDNSKQSL
jgi:DNA-binding transcriptional regulator YhcF (GntR family)